MQTSACNADLSVYNTRMPLGTTVPHATRTLCQHSHGAGDGTSRLGLRMTSTVRLLSNTLPDAQGGDRAKKASKRADLHDWVHGYLAHTKLPPPTDNNRLTCKAGLAKLHGCIIVARVLGCCHAQCWCHGVRAVKQEHHHPLVAPSAMAGLDQCGLHKAAHVGCMHEPQSQVRLGVASNRVECVHKLCWQMLRVFMWSAPTHRFAQWLPTTVNIPGQLQ